MRVHRKIWLWHGRWWAVQLYCNHYVSLGVHFDWHQPVLDLHLGWVIVALGHRPELTKNVDRFRQSCRGFLFSETMKEPVL